MEITYLILNLVVIAITFIVFRVQLNKPSAKWWAGLLSLFLLTAVFDSIIITLHIVGYDDQRILGLKIGTAPIEDFFYPLLSYILISKLWKLFAPKKGSI